MDVTKGNVVGDRREASTGTKNKGGDMEESGLELASEGNERV